MAIVNRDKDGSEQRYVFTFNQSAVVGVSALMNVGTVPCGAQLLQVVTSAFGLSSTPTVGIQIQRFVVGSGLTTIPLNGSSLITISALSTSGIQTQVLPAAASTLLLLQKGDAIQMVTSTANSAANYVVEAVIQILQDVKQDYGV
jgi:hypothetical protein